MRQNIFSTISIGFLFFILGFLGLSLMTGHSLIEYWKQKLMVIVELQDDVEETALEKLDVYLKNAPFVIASSLLIITKEEAAQMMKDEYGNDFLSEDLPNPLHHVYTFNVTKEFSDTLSLEGIRTELKKNSAVYDVYYEANLSQKVSKNISHFIGYGICLSVLFVFVAAFIIRQSLLLQMYDDSKQIKSEEEDWKLPTLQDYLIRYVKNALLSSVIAIGGLMILSYWLELNLGEITYFVQNSQIVIFLLALFFLNVLTHIATTYITYKLAATKTQSSSITIN
jgi:cell division transport system permease protein